MTNPTDLCQCGHARSEHREEEQLYLSGCFHLGNCPCLRFELNHSALAHGHNPDKLTQGQVGTAEGWRLLEDREIMDCVRQDYIQRWSFNSWDLFQAGSIPASTYRTKLTESQLAEKRGLPPAASAHVAKLLGESGNTLSGGVESGSSSAIPAQADAVTESEASPLNPSPVSAATAPAATPEPSSADDAREHVGAPVKTSDELLKLHIADLERRRACITDFIPQTIGDAIMARWPVADIEGHEWDNRTSEENAVWMLKRLLPNVERLPNSSPGQTFRRPNQKEVMPGVIRTSPSVAPPESSPTPDSGGNEEEVRACQENPCLKCGSRARVRSGRHIACARCGKVIMLNFFKPEAASGGKPSLCSRCGGTDPACYICGTGGKLDLKAVARECFREIFSYAFEDGQQERRVLPVLTKYLQKADAAAREECGIELANTQEDYKWRREVVIQERDQTRAEVERLKSRCNELLSIGEKNLALERDVAAWSVTASNHESARNAAYDINAKLRLQLAAIADNLNLQLAARRMANDAWLAEKQAHEQTKAKLAQAKLCSVAAQGWISNIPKKIHPMWPPDQCAESAMKCLEVVKDL